MAKRCPPTWSCSPPATRDRRRWWRSYSARKWRAASDRSGALAMLRSCATCSSARRSRGFGSSPAALRSAASIPSTSPCNLRRAKRVSLRRNESAQTLVRWRNLAHEVAHQLLVRQRLKRHLALGKPRGAGVHRLAINLDHAFLAGTGVDAGEPDRKRRIMVRANPTQSIEHRLARIVRHLIALIARRLPGRAAPHL